MTNSTKSEEDPVYQAIQFELEKRIVLKQDELLENKKIKRKNNQVNLKL